MRIFGLVQDSIVDLPRQQAGLQQCVDDQAHGVQDQQGQALLHVSHEEAPQGPPRATIPTAAGR